MNPVENQKQNRGIVLTYRIIAKNLKPVVRQNAVSLVNAIFLAVSSLLLVLGEMREGLFLGSVLVLNLVIGIVQDLRAKVALERLQILAAPRIVRVSANGQKEQINLEQIKRDDILQIDIGDQVPADGRIVESFGIEVNEALITGESNYVKKNTGDEVLAGSIVMSGFAVFKVEALPQDSFVARMTEKIKKYDPAPSPIQKDLNAFIKYMSYLLLAIIVYVAVRGFQTHDLLVSIVQEIGALTGTLVPQGLVLSITIFFAYGAIKLLKDNVLMQEINATEKLARIKNLCVDKTGTLTERKPVLEEIINYNGNDFDLSQVLAGYIYANRDTSEIAAALRPRAALAFAGRVVDSLPFSSQRKYGAAWLEIGQKPVTAVLGAPDVLAEYFADENEKKLVKEQVDVYAGKAKRLILLARAEKLPAGSLLIGNMLHPAALFVLLDPLRPGTEKIIDFFQKRDVRIRVISGDNPRTVQAVAAQAGMKYADMVVTGREMEAWDDVEYEERVPAFHLFARVKPGQKEKIIKLLKKSGYTAMVGDGANDALAIKKADLGVAMFDGAPATRRIAQVVLMNNSFSALPKGVALAEAIILNIELVAGVFLNKVVVGLAFFLFLAFMKYDYPLTPSNMTVINYFTIWLPMAYWTFLPISEAGFNAKSRFMGKIFLFAIANGLIMALAALAVYVLPPMAGFANSSLLVMIALIVLGYWYFVLAPLNYGAAPDKPRRRVLGIIAAIGAALIIAAIYLPQWAAIFGLRRPDLAPLVFALIIIGAFAYLQYAIAVRWFYKK
jgi:cation-transporting ATPase E